MFHFRVNCRLFKIVPTTTIVPTNAFWFILQKKDSGDGVEAGDANPGENVQTGLDQLLSEEEDALTFHSATSTTTDKAAAAMLLARLKKKNLVRKVLSLTSRRHLGD